MKKVRAIVLAAGKGTRMKSKLNKNLHLLCGKPLIRYPLDLARASGIEDIVVVIGNSAEEMRKTLGEEYRYAYQHQQLGTGHAVMQALDFIREEPTADYLILLGDGPLFSKESIKRVLDSQKDADLTLLTAIQEDPFGFGRVIRKGEEVREIVEERDATAEERAIKEVWTGIACFRGESLISALAELSNDNAQQEYYLTDTAKWLAAKGKKVRGVEAAAGYEMLGVNNRKQLAQAAELINAHYLDELMLAGVTIVDPRNTVIEPTVKIGQDTEILPGSYLRGDTVIGEGSVIGPYAYIENSHIGSETVVNRSSLYNAIVHDRVSIGPFAYLRPETVVMDEAKVGQFVEVKKSTIGKGSKVPHLSYVGDTEIGEHVNLGAGTIIVNYDGKHKHKTVIGDNVFVGCNANLIAPVTISSNTYIAAGSTITEDVPENALAIARAHQVNKEDWMTKREK